MKMKLVIAIFAYNEAETIAEVIRSIPPVISGVTVQSVIVIDDGSTDQTAERAREAGAEVISHKSQRGLPRVFMTAIEAAIERGADIFLHTDGDNQFYQEDIPALIAPIINNKADAVIGNRGVKNLLFMPPANKWGNIIGSAVLNWLLNLERIDVSCGFRAYSKEYFSRLFIFSKHTYTHESLLQLSSLGCRVASVPIRSRPRAKGPSKLIHSVTTHISRSLLTIVRAGLYHSPLRFFTVIGGVFFLIGILLGIRYLIIFSATGTHGHVQSLILASVCLIIGFSIFIVGLHADLINRNTRINLETLYLQRQKRREKNFSGDANEQS